MEKIDSMQDFEDRFLGDSVNLEPRTIKGVNGAFMIQLTGELLETTAQRIKRTVEKYSGEKTTPIYLSLGGTVVAVGNVDMSMEFYREINSLLTPYKPEYFNYIDKERIPFDTSVLISTIKIIRTYDAEKFV